MLGLRRRQNLAFLPRETWRPPLHWSTATVSARTIAAVRRFFDLQAASCWRDLSQLLPKLRGNVLDVGCGAQPYRPLLSACVQYRGIDTANSTVFGYSTPGTQYFRGDSWPVSDETQDVVLCTEVAEHVYDTTRLLAESFRCLKNGGQLILTVPFAARWHFIPHDFWRFTPSSLDRLLTGAGFQSLRIYPRGNAGTVACYKVASLLIPLLIAPVGSVLTRAVKLSLGVCTFPLLLLLALIGHATLMAQGDNDCLGFTVIADCRR